VLVLLLCCLLSLGTGCSGPGEEQPVLNGTSWTLTGWAEVDPVPSQVTITAEFADDRVAGQAGVNRYHASITSATDGSLQVDQVATTRMAGPPEAMTAEAAYLRRLQAASSYRIDGDSLVVLDGDGRSSLTYSRA
jgi:heat shock protein HslJ